jgi:ABC-type lipoprotein export system ATPase subunit
VRLGRGVIELRPAGDGPTAASVPDAPATAAGARIEARGVSRRFGLETALERVDATFEPGMLTVVTGPSGSGKSTLLALLAGLDTPDEGDVVVDGVVLSALDRDARAVFRREHIGVVGQTPGLSGMLTARENVELVLGLRGIDGVEAHERAMDALAIVGLADHAVRRVDRLSAGERERVALARSIASGPGVLVADEPTARLDSATTLAIGGLLADLAREHGTTVICATHDPLLVTLAGAEVALRRTTPAVV